MNTTTNYCNFIEIDTDTFQCVNCNLIVNSQDGYEPILICPSSNDTSLIEPGLLAKTAGLFSSINEHINNGLKLCTEDEISHRYRICSSCEFYDNKKCKLCGCPIFSRKSLFGKLSWKSSRCPLKKW